MRYLVAGAAIVALTSVAAQAQNSAWGFFEGADGSFGAGVQGADGSQLMLKCDKPGKGTVYAAIISKEKLVPPSNTRFQMRPIELRFDTGATVEERYRFYEQMATAVNQTTEKTLQRLLTGLSSAQQLNVRMNPERARWVEASFTVTGAKDAITQVFQKCQDEIPTA
ncbi:hypothetical protein [Altererythrobacter sp. Root672]|uniref:hypothetical protein n=1 Tax=Altererythrobacter sp. Root672 TaxID=1736584 RepID=UPI0006F5EE21|nr:hypothetical protein [Altererythrobacter sp. Root672]KRA83709.1 hypothetical protein ASD76_06705 [Altererythrobacter sp. Root672]